MVLPRTLPCSVFTVSDSAWAEAESPSATPTIIKPMIANLRISFAVVRIAQSSAQYLIRMQGRMHGPHCVQKRYFARRNDKSRGTNPPSNSYKTIMNNLTKASLFLVLALSTALLSAQAKPNFTGVWVLNLAKSDLGGAPITKISVEIDHNDPILKY